MIQYFARHATAANVLMLVMIATGVYFLPELKRETFPFVERYEVRVSVVYPGARAKEVADGLCQPLEDAMEGIAFVEEQRCDARANLAQLTMKMKEDGNFDDFIRDVERAVDAVSTFPQDAEDPVIQQLGDTQPVASIAVSGDVPLLTLTDYAQKLKKDLLRYPTINKVDIKGNVDRQIDIRLDPAKMRKYGLSLQQLADIIRRQNIDLPAGVLETDDRDYAIQVSDLRRTPQQLSDLTILSPDRNHNVRLGDLANIQYRLEDEENISYLDGKPARLLVISKTTSEDSLDVMADIQQFLDRKQGDLPDSIQLALTDDMVSLVKQRLGMLVENGWQGMVLVFLCMWLFFSWRMAFWVVMGLPTSFLAGLAAMYLFGISINMISMVSLLIALGLLMDDAIVISESIATRLHAGAKPVDAVIEGTSQVAAGVFSSFVTTVCMFGGMIWLEGDLGQVLKVIPITLILVLILSLIEAFFILPHHLLHALQHQHQRQPGRFRQAFESAFERLRSKVGGVARLTVRFRYPFVGFMIALFIASVSLIPNGVLKFQAFPDLEGDMVQARVILPQGTPMQVTQQVTEQLITALKQAVAETDENDLIKALFVHYGENNDAFESGVHLVTISLDLKSVEVRDTSITRLSRLWRQHLPVIPEMLSLQIKEPALGPAGRPLEIRLSGAEFDRLKQASLEIQNWLKGYQGVVDVLDDARPAKPEFMIRLKDGHFFHGLDSASLARQLRAAYEGQSIQDIQSGGESYDLRIKMNNEGTSENHALELFPIYSPGSRDSIPLSEVAHIDSERSWARYHRVNGDLTISVLADVDGANVSEVIADMSTRFLPDLQDRFPGLRIQYEGELKNGNVTKKSLGKALLVGLIGVYLLLVFQFRSYMEPIVVMLVIPLGLVGVIWGHMLMGIPLTMPSLVGFVSLAGIVVNDSILLVEFVKMHCRKGVELHQAAENASQDRFRAVLLTSLTTIAGLLPLTFETSLQAQVLIPLVTSIVFGLSFTTILVLFVVPAIFAILADFGFREES